ncbi:MAG: hypothetical protein AAF591_07895 [Verrucomicrobiota bacterium]
MKHKFAYAFASIFLAGAFAALAQDDPPQKTPEPNPPVVEKTEPNPPQQSKKPTRPNAAVDATISEDGTGKIIIEAKGILPKPPSFFTANAVANVQIGPERTTQTISPNIKVTEGKANAFTLELKGDGEVYEVTGDNLVSWAVRTDDDSRVLELRLNKGQDQYNPTIKIRSKEYELPASLNLTHLAPGKAIGFNTIINLNYAPGIQGKITAAKGFTPIHRKGDPTQFQTTTGGQLTVALSPTGTVAGPVEFFNTRLEGTISPDARNGSFQLTGTARVTKPNTAVSIFSGNVAASSVPADAPYQLNLKQVGKGQTHYELVFEKPGNYPITLDFVAPIAHDKEWRSMHFFVTGGAVTPIILDGIDTKTEFREGASVFPTPRGNNQNTTWQGFIPATGQAQLSWKASRKIGEGKLFFSTTARIEATVGADLMRQNHLIDYRILQGELNDLQIALDGPGEILDVEGANVVAWSVSEPDDNATRTLEIKLNEAITDSAQITVRTQHPLGAFPVRVEAMHLTPVGAVRHSGYIRLSNQGSVRLEPADLQGLTQLAPEQFPGDAINARQIFVYRFPSAQHQFDVVADRIQPEINVSQIVLYQLAETDRVINADIELDIREAPVREWDLRMPADYSVVSVSGNSVADYVVGSTIEAGQRNLKVIFGADVAGRQLINLNLEKNEAATAGEWTLPQLNFPDAKSVRGDIGIVGAPGFRIAVAETDLLVEKPLSYFPKNVPNLQQAFRIRETGWSANLQIELLEKSVQADSFHLYSLSEGAAYGSVLINYFITGAPVSEFQLTVPEDLENVVVDGKDYRTYRRDGETLIVTLHQPVIGPYTLLVTFEEKLSQDGASLRPGRVTPLAVQDERGYLQVVSPLQIKIEPTLVSENLLKLDALELPAEFQLLTAAPSLGVWQYTERPFELGVDVTWFEPGAMATQVVEFSEVNSTVSPDGQLVSDLIYYVKSRGQRALRLELPKSVRLWDVSVAGKPANARQAEDATLIPLPGGTDPNIPVEVRLRFGRPAVDGSNPVLALPIVSAPVLKTEWHVHGDKKHILVPKGGSVSPPTPVLRPSGFAWITQNGITGLFLAVLFAAVGIHFTRKNDWQRAIGLMALLIALVISAFMTIEAGAGIGSPAPLHLSIPVLTPNEAVYLHVDSIASWRANLSWLGIFAVGAGVVAVLWSFLIESKNDRARYRIGGALLVALGILTQRDSAPWFFAILTVILGVLLLVLFIKAIRDLLKHLNSRKSKPKEKKKKTPPAYPGPEAATILIGTLTLIFAGTQTAPAQPVIPDGFSAPQSITQEWKIDHDTNRLFANATVKIAGEPGDRFLLLKAPAVLSNFKGKGLRLTTQQVPNEGLAYVVSIPATDSETAAPANFEATFKYELEIADPVAGFAVPTGTAAVQQINASYNQPEWEFTSPSAVKIDSADGNANDSAASILLAPIKNANISLKPRARDVTAEETQFFVEASNLYLPGPGVVDGRHRLNIRPSQGQVKSLAVQIPDGLTVSEVHGPIGSWQFDADQRILQLAVEPAQSKPFDIRIDTQRGLDPLPTDVTVAPISVDEAAGQVGLVALAFGPDAQPEQVDSDSMSLVNVGDFDASLLPNDQYVLHRVYRYGAEGGDLQLRVAPVAPEVRVFSKQVLSFGDERIVLGINFNVDITRAGLFQLSFPLPDGFEVESLSGGALHHWAELTDDNQRQIVLHLNGKTIGSQEFALTLTSSTPAEFENWNVPRFELNEATRQTGDLVVKPTTGIRLNTVSRQNISEVDPRTLGGDSQGALAFRLLQRDWSLVLGIEKLDPWITGQVLHEITLREGQTRTAIDGIFKVQNASIRSLLVRLPVSSEDEIKTLRAGGNAVSDLVRTAPDSDIWEVQFKRRVVGDVEVRIEFERRDDRANNNEQLVLAGFPDVRQLTYHFAVRAGGRLELETGDLPRGWQRADWNAVPQKLRDAGVRTAPALTLRAVTPGQPLNLQVSRHSLAEALKLRVAAGTLTTVLSPTGDQLTAVDLTIEVIQRSSLNIGLPAEGDLFSIFVNGESVHSVRQGDAWQFHILPGADDRTASVRFVYSVPGKRLTRLKLTSPQLNVPLENITWNVMAPEGFALTSEDGNLEQVGKQSWQSFDRDSYLSKASGERQKQAREAEQLLERANEYLQVGDQKKANWALNSVANRYALDAASNEDARVQLENLQTQQAVVGLNTRRQRLYVDNGGVADLTQNEQIIQGAAANPVLNNNDLNFRPQELSQLLQGNTSEDNAVLQRIAGRLVRHQRTIDPAPQNITITLPEEGTIYTFNRSVQVSENAPLELKLGFASTQKIGFWNAVLVLVLLAALAATLLRATRPTTSAN